MRLNVKAVQNFSVRGERFSYIFINLIVHLIISRRGTYKLIKLFRFLYFWTTSSGLTLNRNFLSKSGPFKLTAKSFFRIFFFLFFKLVILAVFYRDFYCSLIALMLAFHVVFFLYNLVWINAHLVNFRWEISNFLNFLRLMSGRSNFYWISCIQVLTGLNLESVDHWFD